MTTTPEIKDSPQVSSCWLFFETIIMMQGTMNVKNTGVYVCATWQCDWAGYGVRFSSFMLLVQLNIKMKYSLNERSIICK